MSKILALIFYNGRVFTGSEGVMFEGNNIAIYLKRDCSLEELKARVRKKLKLRRNQVISNVLVRLWRSDNPLTYHGYSISDDEDMEMMMERYNEDSHLKVIELYVDITEAGSSSTSGPSQTSSHHTVTMGPETHTGGGAALDNVDQPYQGGTFANTYETNVDQPYQGGTFANTYETNVYQSYEGGTFDNTHETNVDQTYQGGTFDNTYDKNADQTVSLGNDDDPHMDADAFEESDEEDRREAGDISDDGSSDDDAGNSELQRRPISPDSPPPLNVALKAAGAYILNL
jgi:hypothetical protein